MMLAAPPLSASTLSTTHVLLVALYVVVTTLATIYVADTKGRGLWTWGILGLLFGVFALILVSIMGTPDVEYSADNIYNGPASSMPRICSKCGKEWKAGTLVCPKCGGETY